LSLSAGVMFGIMVEKHVMRYSGYCQVRCNMY
jgi:hypothetical protein